MGAPGPPEQQKSGRASGALSFQPNFYGKTKPIWVEIVVVTQILMVARDPIDVTLRLEGKYVILYWRTSKNTCEYGTGKFATGCQLAEMS